jgi:DNA-3-methyladenine glycosylase
MVSEMLIQGDKLFDPDQYFCRMTKLPLSFYDRKNVLQVARELVGKILVSKMGGQLTSGRIVECEAYDGVVDRASHAFGGRRTARNEIMYAGPGTAYVYICYGIHHLFNVITNENEIPHAILIRALEPVQGIEVMLKRRGKKKGDTTLTKGPGSLSVAMGITVKQNGLSLTGKEIFIADDGFIIPPKQVFVSPRIGVESAREAAVYPYRFYVKGNPYVSGRPA